MVIMLRLRQHYMRRENVDYASSKWTTSTQTYFPLQTCKYCACVRILLLQNILSLCTVGVDKQSRNHDVRTHPCNSAIVYAFISVLVIF